ncbi:MAG: extracellular solute-binding protein [Steroidobacteraceae bacterium]|nr:extracellular solute-binding protein [Steroidobacteraceae bacterium]
MPRTAFARAIALLAVTAIAWLASGTAHAETLVVYSARNEQLIKPIFDLYTRETGVAIKFTTGDAAVLTERLAAEGSNSPADILMTVDAGELWHAAERGLLRPVSSRVLERNIPAHLRDPGDRWFGFSQRARTIVYSPARVDAKRLSTYAALAEPQWRGRLCLRTSKKVYNQSLVATMIAAQGEQKTEQIVRGWVANLATEVFANDTQLLEAIAAGQCDVGIVNTYYFGRIVKERADFPVKVFWANQGAGGTHVNVSGAGVTRHARNAAAATRFLEWLSSGPAQAWFAAVNLEFPANPTATVDPVVASWGKFEASPINVAEAGRLQPAAVRLMDRAGYR